MSGMITTVQQHILQQQQEISEATGRFSWLLSGITLATKMVEAKIRTAGLGDVLGALGAVNVQGEQQQKLDVYANQALLHCLGLRDSVAALVSEENDEPVTFNRSVEAGKYIIVFDPLDGSSNIDVNVNVGTIFSVLRRLPSDHSTDLQPSILQCGHTQVAAGYVVYGPSTVLVYTTGHGVHGFTLDPTIGAFVLTNEHMKMPEQGNYYSVNEANASTWPDEYREYVGKLRSGALGRSYSSATSAAWSPTSTAPCSKAASSSIRRRSNSPAASCACFTRPTRSPSSPSRPAAWPPADRAASSTSSPTAIHQRTPFIVGSKREIEALVDGRAK